MNARLAPLIRSLTEIRQLSGISALLSWDQETYMPKGALEARANQKALLAELAHKAHTSDAFRDALGECVDLSSGLPLAEDWTSEEIRLLEEIHRDWRIHTAIPTEFATEFAKLTAKAHHAWQVARENNTFETFSPYLKQLVDLAKQKADFLGGASPYETLLDLHEPGMTLSRLNPVFDHLKTEVVSILQTIQSCDATFVSLHADHYDEQKQWDFGLGILKDMGYNFETGRQDRSTHPFTTEFHPTDVRITTRIDKHNLWEALSSSIHEGGHALYEQGLDQSWYGTPFCESISLGIHESQSRLWETFIGMSLGFWEGYYPQLQKVFPSELGGIELSEFYRSVNQIKPGLIRVAADELTYHLHILIRYEIEKALFESDLDVNDLPALWRQKYKDYLGVSPETDTLGVLQDVHWSGGHFGYFPTYTIGTLYAAMLHDQMRSELGDLDDILRNRNLTQVTEWLSAHVFQVGRRRKAHELIQELTGKTLESGPFLGYLRHKYASVYQIPL